MSLWTKDFIKVVTEAHLVSSSSASVASTSSDTFTHSDTSTHSATSTRSATSTCTNSEPSSTPCCCTLATKSIFNDTQVSFMKQQ
eukprot:Awhi_evm1s8079